MPVYFIQAGERGPVKIGIADDPWSRLGDLQVGNHEPLRILRILDAGLADEVRLHERFEHLHYRGEWFSFSREMLGDLGYSDLAVETAPEPVPQLPSDAESVDVSWIIRALGGIAAAANWLDVEYNIIVTWQRRNKIPAHKVPTVQAALHQAGFSVPDKALAGHLARKPRSTPPF